MEEAAQAPAGGQSLTLLPASTPDKPHIGEITRAGIQKKDFDWTKSAANPAGQCLVLTVQVAGHLPFEATIPCHYTTKVAAMCRSARVHPPVAGEDWDEQELVGKTVTVETDTAISGRGTEYVKVLKWLPNSEPLPKAMKAAPARSQPAKAHKAFTETAAAVNASCV